MLNYQEIKPIILNFLDVSRDAIHIHIGFACLALVLLVTTKKLSSFSILLPGFIVSLLMELMDLRDYYNFRGRFIFVDHLHDLVNTNLIPFILVLLAKRKKIRLENQPDQL